MLKDKEITVEVEEAIAALREKAKNELKTDQALKDEVKAALKTELTEEVKTQLKADQALKDEVKAEPSNEIQEKANKLEQIEKEKTDLQTKFDQQKQALEAAKKEVKNKQQENKDLEDKVKQLEKGALEATKLQTDFEALETELKAAEEKQKELQDQLKKAEEALKTKTTELETQLKAAEEKNKESEAEKLKADDKIKELQVQLDTANTGKTFLQQQLANSTDEQQKVSEAIDGLFTKELNGEIKGLIGSTDQDSKDKVKGLGKLKSRIESIIGNGQSKNVDEIVESIKEELKNSIINASKFSKEVVDLKVELEAKAQINTLNTEVEKLKKELENKGSEIQKLGEKNKELEAKNKTRQWSEVYRYCWYGSCCWTDSIYCT
ncbi:hypothetical protein [Wolbachia endosymbiont (group A) of Myopa testacea]|uniref:hypothetical protein n=1 Tax=Wolbachia endosymbiont (group A) of Myopa testacea TaxID=3066148 RepID=UPI003132B0C6